VRHVYRPGWWRAAHCCAARWRAAGVARKSPIASSAVNTAGSAMARSRGGKASRARWVVATLSRRARPIVLPNVPPIESAGLLQASTIRSDGSALPTTWLIWLFPWTFSVRRMPARRTDPAAGGLGVATTAQHRGPRRTASMWWLWLMTGQYVRRLKTQHNLSPLQLRVTTWSSAQSNARRFARLRRFPTSRRGKARRLCNCALRDLASIGK
jgi:hypothetical protein